MFGTILIVVLILLLRVPFPNGITAAGGATALAVGSA
jgi:hypothetical protein